MTRLTLRNALTLIGKFLYVLGAVVFIAWFFIGAEPAWQCGIGDAIIRAQVQTVWGCLHKADLDPAQSLLLLLAGAFMSWASRFAPTTQQSNSTHRKDLLSLMQAYHIDTVLKGFVDESKALELDMELQPEAVKRPPGVATTMFDEPKYMFGNGTDILSVFRHSNSSLLILGAPGAGKTTTLLQLTEKLLIAAREDDAQPIPVVLNLQSWHNRIKQFEDWVVDEIQAQYRMPRASIRSWIASNELALMLDGLDEVDKTLRKECVDAINTVCSKHSLKMAISSRRDEYQNTEARLETNAAIFLKPLSTTQITGHLLQFGAEGRALNRYLAEQTDMAQLAQTPLMLSIMVKSTPRLLYGAVIPRLSRSQGRQQLLDSYIAVKFFENGVSTAHASRFVLYLNCLARSMIIGQYTLFYPEFSPLLMSKNPRRSRIIRTISKLLFLLSEALLICAVLFLTLTGLNETGLLDRATYAVLSTSKVLTGTGNVLGMLAVLGIITSLVFQLLSHSKLPLDLSADEQAILSTMLRRQATYSTVRAFMAFIGVMAALFLLVPMTMTTLSASLPSEIARPWQSPVSMPNSIFATGFYLTSTIGVCVAILHFVTEDLLPKILLAKEGSFPFDNLSFLEYCVRFKLMYRVGGGYMFIHNVFIKHFAELNPERLHLEKP